MKPLYVLPLAIFVALAMQCSIAMSFPPSQGELTLRGNLTATCIPHRGGVVYLQMEVNAEGFSLPERSYQPMNVAVVLDRSGSMADEHKIDYAKQAIAALVDRLSTNDYLSIVIYDDRIETLLPTQRVTDKSRIKQLVNEITPRGSTNLGGGMEEGFRQIEKNFKREFINRVILLSDGLANQGITDPNSLNRIVSRYRNQSISLTTIGVGLDYNENLMLGLSEHGGGNYYFVESPGQLASILEKETNGMSYIVAQNAHIELELANGVAVNDVIGCERREERGRWIIPVGDIYANDHREITVELTIPEGAGVKHIVEGTMYTVDNHRANGRARFSLDIRYTDDAAELIKNKNWDMQAKADVAVSTRTVERAMEALDAGRDEEAAKELSSAQSMLNSSPAMVNSPAGGAAMQEQVNQLRQYSNDLKDSRTDKRKLKKSMQYDNYKVQKKKE
jgi:Ca-activated chloride channel family protein